MTRAALSSNQWHIQAVLLAGKEGERTDLRTQSEEGGGESFGPTTGTTRSAVAVKPRLVARASLWEEDHALP